MNEPFLEIVNNASALKHLYTDVQDIWQQLSMIQGVKITFKDIFLGIDEKHTNDSNELLFMIAYNDYKRSIIASGLSYACDKFVLVEV